MENKEIVVTGCHDCPFKEMDNWCEIVADDVIFEAIANVVIYPAH